MKDKERSDRENEKFSKGIDHTAKRMDKANQKAAEKHVKSLNSESAMFDFDLK